MKYRIAGNLRERKLLRISRFCGYLRKFLREIWGRGILWHSTSDQSAKVFSAKIVIFTNSRKFSPSKVSRYMVRPTVRCTCALFRVTCFINERALLSKIRLQQCMSIILHHQFCTQIAGMRRKHV